VTVDVAPVLVRERITHEQFMAWCDEDTNAELINGVIIMHTPASIAHEELFSFLLMILKAYVEHWELGKVYGSRVAVQLEEGHTYEPDLLFVARNRLHIIGENAVHGAPDLVAEILSASTYRYDTGDKRDGYERAGVRELWLIDPYGPEGTQVSYRDEATGTFVPLEMEEGVYRSTVIRGLALRSEWLWPPEGRFPGAIQVLRELGVD
jgi:Uma2 family endonuclease